MIQKIIWGISFFTLWLTIIWLFVIFSETEKRRKIKKLFSISIAIPAYNEAKTLEKTVTSLVNLDYPKAKKEIIIVNDGSRDRTADVAGDIIKKFPKYKIQLINKKNGGKASAVNAALAAAKGELFAVVDADSRVSKESLRYLVPYFYNKRTGAVISRIKVDEPRNLLERIQRFEYIMSNMIRNIMALFGTLAITPGVLSTYRTETLRKVGGFTKDRSNLTEDLEIAMRLKYHGYAVEMEPRSLTYTYVPKGIKSLWRQRIRWSRGYIFNLWKYRKMFLSKKHGVFGVFQMPANVLVVSLLIINMSLIGFSLLKDSLETLIRSITIEGYFINHFMDFPTIKQIVLGNNLSIMLPVYAVGGLSIFLIYLAHKRFQEKVFRHVTSIAGYFIFIPYFTTVNWVSSIFQEVFKWKRKW